MLAVLIAVFSAFVPTLMNGGESGQNLFVLVGFGLMFLVQNVAYLIWGADLRVEGVVVELLDGADNLAAADLKLPAEIADKLTEASAPEQADYPYGKGGVNQRFRKIEGGR